MWSPLSYICWMPWSLWKDSIGNFNPTEIFRNRLNTDFGLQRSCTNVSSCSTWFDKGECWSLFPPPSAQQLQHSLPIDAHQRRPVSLTDFKLYWAHLTTEPVFELHWMSTWRRWTLRIDMYVQYKGFTIKGKGSRLVHECSSVGLAFTATLPVGKDEGAALAASATSVTVEWSPAAAAPATFTNLTLSWVRMWTPKISSESDILSNFISFPPKSTKNTEPVLLKVVTRTSSTGHLHQTDTFLWWPIDAQLFSCLNPSNYYRKDKIGS